MEDRLLNSYAQKELIPYLDVFTGKKPLEECSEMEKNMLYYMPLSSLRSFSGITNEKIGEIVKEMRQILQNSNDD